MKRIHLGYGLLIWVSLIVAWQAGQYLILSRQDPAARLSLSEPRTKGRALSASCAACHDLYGRKNGVGPSLFGIVGRRAGSVDGFAYSSAMKNADFVWTRERLRRFLIDPLAVVPNTAMGISGVAEADVDELVEYLEFRK